LTCVRLQFHIGALKPLKRVTVAPSLLDTQLKQGVNEMGRGRKNLRCCTMELWNAWHDTMRHRFSAHRFNIPIGQVHITPVTSESPQPVGFQGDLATIRCASQARSATGLILISQYSIIPPLFSRIGTFLSKNREKTCCQVVRFCLSMASRHRLGARGKPVLPHQMHD